MIRPERVRTMTRLAMMETGTEREKLNIARHRKSDYYAQQIVFSLFAGTLCFIALSILWGAIRWDDLDAVIDIGNPSAMAGRLLLTYLLFLLAYLGLSMLVFHKKYQAAHEYGMKYLDKLNELEAEMTQQEEASSRILSGQDL